MIKIPGVYVPFRGDYSQLEKDAKAARAMITTQARGMSDALNNALSPTNIRNNVSKLTSNLGTLNRASADLDKTFNSISVELGDLRKNTGLTADQFGKLQQKMLRQQAAVTQERALKNIARQAGLTRKEVGQLGKTFGLSAAQIKKVNQQLGNTPKKMKAVEQMSGSIRANLAALAGVYIGLNGIQSLARLSDEYTNINSKLKLVTDGAEHFNEVYGELFKISQETGTVFGTNAINYANLALALQDLDDVGSNTLLPLFRDINKSLIVAGASTQEINSFMLQFKQALGANRLQGDEFRGMLEANAYWAGQFAKALDTDISGLYEMKEAGELTTRVVLDAHKKMSKEISADFSGMTKTISRASNELNNAWKAIFADIDRAHGGSNKIAEAISDLAKTITENKNEISSAFEGLIKGADLAVKGVGGVVKAWKHLYNISNAEAHGMSLSEALGMSSKELEFEIDSGIATLKGKLAQVREDLMLAKDPVSNFFVDDEVLAAKVANLEEQERKIIASIQRIQDASKIERTDNALNDFFGDLDSQGKVDTVVSNIKRIGDAKAAANIGGGGEYLDSWLVADDSYDLQSRGYQAAIDKEQALIKEGLEGAGDYVDSWQQAYDQRYELQSRALDAMIEQEEESTSIMAEAFTGWASNMAADITDAVFESADSFKELPREFAKAVFQMYVQKKMLEPLFDGLGGGTGVLGTVGSFLGFHEGGVVGKDSPTFTRLMPVPPVSTLPKHHTGLGANEFLAVLEREETVFTKGQMDRLGAAVNASQAGGGNSVTIPLTAYGMDEKWVENFRGDLQRWVDARIREAA